MKYYRTSLAGLFDWKLDCLDEVMVLAKLKLPTVKMTEAVIYIS